MNRIKNQFLAIFIFITLFFSSSFITAESQAVFFDITIISPTTCPVKNIWEPLLDEQLPLIGINVIHEYFGWGLIMPRLWKYPVGQEGYKDYIPPYNEGGYDILTVGWSWGLDWNPKGVFDSSSIVPMGDNSYQYNNSEFDVVLEDYLTEYDEDSRIAKGKTLQSILYEDLPSITILYPRDAYYYLESTVGVDFELLQNAIPRGENWKNNQKDNITFVTTYQFQFLPNAFRADSYFEQIICNLLFYGLFERAQETHMYEPVIAKNYTVSEDKLTITVDLNPKAFFSNGEQVTAEDVVYSYQLYMTPEVADASGLQYYKDLTEFFENNDSIQMIDDDTVQFHLKKPYAFWKNLVSLKILNKKLIEEYIDSNGYNFDSEDISLLTGAGPFTILNVSQDFSEENQTLILHKNEYWQLTDDLSLDTIIIKAGVYDDNAEDMITNQEADILDYMYSHYDILENNTNYKKISPRSLSHSELMMNMRHPIFGTGELTPLGTAEAANKIRKAISHSIPRDLIIEELLDGNAGVGVVPYPEGTVGFDTELQPYSYNISLAKSLMEEAGYDFSPITNTEPTDTPYSFIFIFSLVGLTIIVSMRKK